MTIQRTALITATLISFSSWVAGEQVLITVDVTDPSAVVFTGTGASSAIDDSSSNSLAGVHLVGLFASDYEASGGSFLSTLSPSGTSELYTSITNGFNFNAVTLRDLNIFDNESPSGDQVFSTSEPAFSGANTYNLSGAAFGPIGSAGDIRVGDTFSGSGAVIGQYQIVPEPTSLAMLGLGGLLLALRRRG